MCVIVYINNADTKTPRYLSVVNIIKQTVAMKPTSSSVKLSTSSTGSKSKKSSKDREKRKSQSTSESSNQHNSDKGSPNKDGSTRKYAGYGPDQLTIMAEQSIYEHLTEEVCMAFTEDLNYKLRHVIYDALAKARRCNRNYITAMDIDDTFECLQIDEVYGAPSTPIWIPFGDQNLHYLDDSKINLIELAEETRSFVQPEEPICTRKWLPETKEVSKSLRTYFALMCQAVVNKDEKLRLTALADISENSAIGPIVEWFYHFGYFLLSKDITYDSLTLSAVDLIEALESNQIALQIVSDKQITLLARLLLQRLLRSITMSEVLKPMCRVLAILCKRIPPRKMVLKKLVSKFPEIRDDFALPVICAVNHLGLDAIYAVLLPHLKYLLSVIEDHSEPDLAYEILMSYNILCEGGKNLGAVCDAYFEVFNDGIVPIWRYPALTLKDLQKPESNWLNIRVQLFKSRRKIPPHETKKHKKIHIEEAFPEDDDDVKKEVFEYEFENQPIEETPVSSKPSITFKFHSFAPAVGRLRFLNVAKSHTSQCPATHVTIGKRTLLVPVLKNFKSLSSCTTCIDHSIMYYNL